MDRPGTTVTAKETAALVLPVIVGLSVWLLLALITLILALELSVKKRKTLMARDDDDLIDIGGGHYRQRPTSKQTMELIDWLDELNNTDRNIGVDFYDGLDPEEWHRRADAKSRTRAVPDLLRDV